MLLLYKLKIIDVIHSKKAISYKNGELVFKKAKELITSDSYMEISFAGITLTTSAFLTGFIDPLLILLPGEKFKMHVSFIEVHWRIRPLINMVIIRSREFFDDPNGFTELIEKAINEP